MTKTVKGERQVTSQQLIRDIKHTWIKLLYALCIVMAFLGAENSCITPRSLYDKKKHCLLFVWMNLIGRYWFSLKYFPHCISYLAWNSRQRIRPIPFATSSLLLHTSEVRHKLFLLKRMQWLVERNNWWMLRYKCVQNVDLVLHLLRPRPLKN